MEIERERVSSSQNERNLGGRCSKTNKDEQGGRGRGSKLGNLERKYFLNFPL